MQKRHHVELDTFDVPLIFLSAIDIITGVDTCTARSALWINPSLCTVSSLRINCINTYMHLLVWWYLSYCTSTHLFRRQRPRQPHPSAAKHKFFQQTMSCLKYYLKKNVLKRKTSAWCMISLCRGRWQMTKFNLRWRNLWFGPVWLVIWRCKKVNDCEVLLLLFLILHILNRTLMRCLCSKISTCADRELCDSESDMPWGIQMCMVSLNTMLCWHHCCSSVAFDWPCSLIPRMHSIFPFSTGWHSNLIQTSPSYTTNFELHSFHLGPKE